ncbi:zinc-binding dehydrogenase [Salinarimonas sp. NSM]|uniref:zinc-binding dehydrogenase n=1 Tax=Salinarimonas sp. NSM TaxID=3458003 RepID=UPI004035C874
MPIARIVRLTAPRTLVWEEVEVAPPAAGAIVASTVASAISPGTELAAYTGAPPLRPGPAYPRLQGYCNVARVVEVGADVRDVRPGDLVLTHQSHRSAFACARDAVLARAPGDADAAALSVTYLFHLGLAALQKAGFAPGMRVAVLGLGPLGLGTLAVVEASGGDGYAVSDQPRARERAAAFGARAVASREEAEIARLLPGGADIVVVTTNGWADWRLALMLARHGGTIAVLGFPGRGQPPADFNPLASEFLYDKQLTIMGCGAVIESDPPEHEARFTLRRNMLWLADRVLSGRLPARAMVSDVLPAQAIETAYARLEAREPDLVTIVLQW